LKGQSLVVLFTQRRRHGLFFVCEVEGGGASQVQDGEVSVKRAAQILGIPADAIYNRLRLGQVPASTRAGRWCIPWDADAQEVYRQKVARSFRLKPNPPVADTHHSSPSATT
jgi:hypothetical protein